jgi:hypothetical protein
MLRFISAAQLRPDELADASQEDELLSAYKWQAIAIRGRQTGDLAKEIAHALVPAYADLFGPSVQPLRKNKAGDRSASTRFCAPGWMRRLPLPAPQNTSPAWSVFTKSLMGQTWTASNR